MKQRRFAFAPEARTDLVDAWRLIYINDGADRADRLFARIEAFCRSLDEFSDIGTRRDDLRPGLRTVGVPGLSTVTVLFVVDGDNVTVIRIGYLGRNVLAQIQQD